MRRARNRTRSSVASSAPWTSSRTTINGRAEEHSASSVAWNSSPRGASSSRRWATVPPMAAEMSASGPRGRGVARASHRPHTTCVSGCSSANCVSSAVLPTPASPATSTTPPDPAAASSRARPRTANASSRSSSLAAATGDDRRPSGPGATTGGTQWRRQVSPGGAPCPARGRRSGRAAAGRGDDPVDRAHVEGAVDAVDVVELAGHLAELLRPHRLGDLGELGRAARLVVAGRRSATPLLGVRPPAGRRRRARGPRGRTPSPPRARRRSPTRRSPRRRHLQWSLSALENTTKAPPW